MAIHNNCILRFAELLATSYDLYVFLWSVLVYFKPKPTLSHGNA